VTKVSHRLLDFKTQERYYTKIVDRYMSFCSRAGRGDELLRRLASLNLQPENTNSSTPPPSTSAASSTTDLSADSDSQGHKDLSILIMAMRKLREGLVASSRIDSFSTQCYIFCIRLSIQLKHMESYHPALSYLLSTIHPAEPLPTPLLSEFASYLVLDLACRQGDLGRAYAARLRWGVKDKAVADVLRALAHDNYVLWGKVKRSVDGHRARIMEFAEDGMRMQALKCLGRTYLTVQLEFVEGVTGRRWSELVRGDKVGWELQGGKVVIRRPKGS
jgi:hypothetical protein